MRRIFLKPKCLAAGLALSAMAFGVGCGGRDDNLSGDTAAVVPPVGGPLAGTPGAPAEGGAAAAGVPGAVTGVPGAAPLSPVEAAPLDIPTEMYEIQEGDTLWEIASAHNISVAKLKKLNGMEGSFIRYGQKIKVPAGAAPAPAPTATPGLPAAEPPAVAVPPTSAPVAPRPDPAPLSPRLPAAEELQPVLPAPPSGAGAAFGFGADSAPRAVDEGVIDLSPRN